MRRLAYALVAAALVITTPVPARAGEGECQDNDGVTVVVDFQELGGGVVVRCAPAPVKDGFDALLRADVPFDTFQGAICRLYGKPEDACGRYPSASAYWSYWLAPRGGEWCYSNVGASRTPPPGSVDGWSFAKNKSGNSLPPPRYPVPGPIPGQDPRPLPKGDCAYASSSSTTTRPPQPPPTNPTPTTATPAGISGAQMQDPAAGELSQGAPVSGDGGEPGPAVSDPGVQGTSDEPANPVAADAPTPAPVPGSLETAAPLPDTGQAAPVVSSPPLTPGSSPAGAALALLIVAALTAQSLWLRRRRPDA